MTWQPVSFAAWLRQRKCAVLAFYHRCRRILEADLVIAIRTEPKPTPSLPPLLDYHPSEALGLREAMIRDRQAAMERRDMRAVHEIENDLRDVTLAMMSRG
jgi:hypothetical protein